MTASASDRVAFLSPDGLDFVTERHLATLTTLRPDGSPHVTPVGFTWDDAQGTAYVICSGASRKAANVRAGGALALCQLDGRRWVTIEGAGHVSADPTDVADAVARYAQRYRQPRVNPARVAIIIAARRVLGSPQLLG
jgi:F420H(2)-dependent biliverdin reductase